MGTTSNITAGDGNDTIYGAAGNNTINVGNGNDTIYAYDSNNTITAGTGNDTIGLGDGNNSISLTGSTGTDHISLGDGNNTLNLGLGHNTAVSLTGTGGTENISMTGGNLYVDLSSTTGGTTVNVSHPTDAAGAETFYMDFAGHGVDSISGAAHGTNWTNTMDFSGHTTVNTSLYIEDGTGNGHSVAANAHGTLTLTGTAAESGTVYTDATKQHELAHFENMDKFIY